MTSSPAAAACVMLLSIALACDGGSRTPTTESTPEPTPPPSPTPTPEPEPTTVFPPAGRSAPTCTQEIELLSPSGRLCGRVVLHEDASGCTTGAADQGWDDTVVQQSGKGPCRYRWWPGLLAGD